MSDQVSDDGNFRHDFSSKRRQGILRRRDAHLILATLSAQLSTLKSPIPRSHAWLIYDNTFVAQAFLQHASEAASRADDGQIETLSPRTLEKSFADRIFVRGSLDGRSDDYDTSALANAIEFGAELTPSVLSA